MKIENVRLGKACNSSSMHSILLKKPEGVSDDPPSEPGQFGWEGFTLTSDESKRKYLSAMLTDSMRREFGTEVGNLVIKDLFGLDLAHPDDYVDHQSQIEWPNKFGTDKVSTEFIQEFIKFVLDDQRAILGGNDNDGEHWLEASEEENIVRMHTYGGRHRETVCRRHSEGVWTLFNPSSGAKVRINFTDDQAPEKPRAPELVDIKVTDYCPYGCTYCYMGSTKQGNHAIKSMAWKVAQALGQLEVFEVALGGGEPTLHPDIINLIHAFKKHGISVGITTKNYQWAIENYDKVDALAFSVDSDPGVVSLRQVQETIQDNVSWHERPSLTAHLVDGILPYPQTISILMDLIQLRIPVTILGLKTTGRGANVTRQYEPRKELVEIASENYNVRVDTAFIQQYKKFLGNVSETSYAEFEGVTSCYIDLVSGSMGPSSYCDKDKMVPLGSHDQEAIAKIFETF